MKGATHSFIQWTCAYHAQLIQALSFHVHCCRTHDCTNACISEGSHQHQRPLRQKEHVHQRVLEISGCCNLLQPALDCRWEGPELWQSSLEIHLQCRACLKACIGPRQTSCRHAQNRMMPFDSLMPEYCGRCCLLGHMLSLAWKTWQPLPNNWLLESGKDCRLFRLAGSKGSCRGSPLLCRR